MDFFKVPLAIVPSVLLGLKITRIASNIENSDFSSGSAEKGMLLA